MNRDAKLIGSIDMGTTKVSAMIGERQNDFLRIIGIGTTAADGLRQGVVVDIEKASRAVMKAVSDAEKMAGTSLREYNVGVAGEHIRSMNSRGVVGIPSPEMEIGPEDIERSLRAARKFALPADREILHTLPQQYIVDNQDGIREPSGMHGTRLEARAHVVTASRPALDNIARTLDNCRLDIGHLVLEPLASSYAVLSDEEREMGVMVIDMGGGTTDVMIYDDVGVVASGVIGIGGNNITGDLAYGLRTPMRAAEAIKHEYGYAMSGMVATDEKIDVPGVGSREPRQTGTRYIAAIIEPRVTELFALINDQVAGSGLKRALGAGVVITGGSSMLRGIRELAEQIFDLPTRIGTPVGVEGLVEVVNHPRYATGVGLLRYEGEPGAIKSQRFNAAHWWRESFSQLRRAIAGFI